MSYRLDQALKRLSASEFVLLGGGFVILHRHQRWHLLTMNYFGAELGLHTLHFLSDSRGRSTVREWLSLGRIVPMHDVSEILPQEAEAKVLAQAEDYLPWIQSGLIDLGGGPTTDTQEFLGFDLSKPDQALSMVRKLMHERKQGAYLRFTSTFHALSEQVA
jgi:hypothetical protein